MNTVTFIYITLLVVSVLASATIYFDRQAPLYLKLFPPFLIITTCVETIGYYTRIKGINSAPMFNFFTTFEFVFYFCILYSIINLQKIKKVILFCLWLYPVMAIINILFIQGITRMHFYTLNVGAILIVIFCIAYFYQLIKFPKQAYPLREPAFWICCGLLFFYSITLPIMAGMKLLLFRDSFELKLYYILINISNFFLYGLFTLAFICRLRLAEPSARKG
jgi:hypothetical protein